MKSETLPCNHTDNNCWNDEQDDLCPSYGIGYKRRLHEIEEDRRTNYELNRNDHSIEIIKKNKKNETNIEIDNVNTNVNNSTNTVNNYIGCQNSHNVDIHDNNINNEDTEDHVYSVDDNNKIIRRKTRRGKQKNRQSHNLRKKDKKI